MSGHNKWSKIKRAKGAADAKRGKVFTKLLREIEVAARTAGGDPKSNPRLRDAVAEARTHNMPKDNIERAISRGMGELEGQAFEQILYEGYGPGGVAILIDCLTDNRNRTVADLRALLTRNHASLAEAGAVAWMFQKKGVVTLAPNAAPEEKLMEMALDAGAEDILADADAMEVISSPETLEKIKQALESAGIPIRSAGIAMIPKNTIEVQGESAERLLELLDLLEDLDDVQKVWSNWG